MDEIWKDIKDYEGLYEVSNWGRVKSLPRNGTVKYARILKPCTDRCGYLFVGLYKNNKQKNFFIHQLVAQAFLDNPNNLPQVNHKDENKQNNNAENLEFCDCKYNVNYGTAIARRSKKISKPVLQYDLEGNFIKEWKSAKQAEREGGFNHENITTCCKGRQKTHKDFIWRYK